MANVITGVTSYSLKVNGAAVTLVSTGLALANILILIEQQIREEKPIMFFDGLTRHSYAIGCCDELVFTLSEGPAIPVVCTPADFCA